MATKTEVAIRIAVLIIIGCTLWFAPVIGIRFGVETDTVLITVPIIILLYLIFSD